ncbi:hypothetical protein [Affinirhizobium pseudoryzae]|uniref:hypothetical protein n=1 Tax=Allorhizobium pseudoryzae TaxID=379684 RepID=UPI0013EA75EA|nr:hypothetical protein [Allorhizobium pseudoryzae]
MHAFRSRRDNAAAYDILPPEAIGSNRPVRMPARADVEDAHFVTVREDTRTQRFQNDNRKRQPKPAMRVAEAAPSLLQRLLSRFEALLMRMSADFFSALVAFVFIVVFGLAGGFSLVAGAGSDPAQAAGLDITHVTLTPQDADGLRVLVINGIVENRAGARIEVPPIRADILVDGMPVASTLIALPISDLAHDHSRGFTAKIPHPGGKNPQLRLSFAETGATAS